MRAAQVSPEASRLVCGGGGATTISPGPAVNVSVEKRLQVIQMPHLGALSGSYLSWGSTVSKAEAEVLVDPGQSFYFPDTNRLRLGKQV